MPREKVILVNVAGVRLIITATTTLVFEPQSQSSQRFIQAVLPRLSRDLPPHGHASDQGSHPWDAQHHAGDGNRSEDRDSPPTPFELDMIEGALLVATSKLDAELAGVYTKVQDVLSRLPAETTPINLEALRRTKSSLVELEGRAETLVQLLEEVLDDVDELRDFNLSSRPIREEKRRQRERERLERERDSRRQQETERAGRERGREEGAEGRVAYADGDYDGQYDGFSNVDDAIQELEDAEIEEQELEEVEDLLEYYLQRVASTQSEAERLLAGARDMEESISVSLSARRLAVVRLELMLR